jgi:hypothetical protein
MDSISLSSKMSHQDFMILILNNLLESYDVILDGKESRLMLADSDHREHPRQLSSRFERIVKNESAREEEQALAAYSKQFKGRCSKCGEYGHKSGDCKDDKKGGSSFKGSCSYCEEKGHVIADCEVKRKAEAICQEKAVCATDEVDDEEESVASLGF